MNYKLFTIDPILSFFLKNIIYFKVKGKMKFKEIISRFLDMWRRNILGS